MRTTGQRFLIFWIGLLHLLAIQAVAQSPVVVNEAFQSQNIVPGVLDVAQSDVVLPPDLIMQGAYDYLFEPAKEYYLSLPEAEDGYWLHFTLRNDLSYPKTVILWLGRRNFDQFDLWQQAPAGTIYPLGQVGSKYGDDAGFILTNGFYYTITLRPGVNECRAKISSVGGPIYVSFSLLSMDAFALKNRYSVLLFGIFLGVMMVSLVFSCQMLFQYRDPAYLFYCVYIVSILLREGYNNGAYFTCSPVILRHCITFLMISSFGMFLRYFLVLWNVNKSLDLYVKWYLWGVKAFMVIYAVGIVYGMYALGSIILKGLVVSSLFFVLLLLIVCFRLFKTSERARVVIYAFLPIAWAIILNLLRNLNAIPNYPILESALVGGFMLEVIIFTIAFTRWFRAMEDDRNLYQLKISVEQQSTTMAVQVAEQRVKDRIARDLHDDVAASMSGIRILTQVAQRQFADKAPQAMPLLEQINRSTTTMLESIGDLIWAIKSHPDYLNDLADRIREYATRTLDATDIRYQLHIPRDLPILELDVEIRRNIYLILKEAINNVLLHSQCRHANIGIRVDDNMLTLYIDDDGAGFNQSVKPKGQGLEHIIWRAESIHAFLNITSAPGQGTHIQLQLPLEFNVSPIQPLL